METNTSTNIDISMTNVIIPDSEKSGSPLAIDREIRDSIRSIHQSILEIALGLVKIKDSKLFKELGHRSMTAYIIRLAEENGMDRSCVFNWLYIGQAYTKYRNELEEAGFSGNDGVTKLPYLQRALAKNSRKEVFRNIKTMSVREFISWALGRASSKDAEQDYRGNWVITEKGNNYYIDGRLAIVVSSKINRRASIYIKKVIRVICDALARQGVIMPLLFPNRRTLHRCWPEVDRMVRQMGIV